jgi:hypothetical protein
VRTATTLSGAARRTRSEHRGMTAAMTTTLLVVIACAIAALVAVPPM